MARHGGTRLTPRTLDGHDIPALTVDTIVHHDGHVLLIRRANPPFAGTWALPGGFVEYNERVEDAAVRETREETGLDVTLDRLLGVYSAPDRDPRHHTVSIVFLAHPARSSDVQRARGGSDATEARWFPLDQPPELAFDHDHILHDATRHLRGT